MAEKLKWEKKKVKDMHLYVFFGPYMSLLPQKLINGCR